jgi:hypothetical protein
VAGGLILLGAVVLVGSLLLLLGKRHLDRDVARASAAGTLTAPEALA